MEGKQRKKANKIMENLVTIHRDIHWGLIDSGIRSSLDKENTSLKYSKIINMNKSVQLRMLFYYHAFSEYAVELDNYVNNLDTESGDHDSLDQFMKDVHFAIERMIVFITHYDIELVYKERFVNSPGVQELFKLLDIDKDVILTEIREDLRT